MKQEQELREQIVEVGLSLYRRGLSPGSSGNISVRMEDNWLVTPTNSSLGNLNPGNLSKLDWDGNLLSGEKPSKEAFLHLAMYRKRPQSGAIVHLHSTFAAAVSCLNGLDSQSCIPPITPYFVMRVGKLPLLPYYPPGDKSLAQEIEKYAAKHSSVLLANHGPVVCRDRLEIGDVRSRRTRRNLQAYAVIAWPADPHSRCSPTKATTRDFRSGMGLLKISETDRLRNIDLEIEPNRPRLVATMSLCLNSKELDSWGLVPWDSAWQHNC